MLPTKKPAPPCSMKNTPRWICIWLIQIHRTKIDAHHMKNYPLDSLIVYLICRDVIPIYLVSRPLWWGDELCDFASVFARETSCHLRKGGLVVSHANCEALKVVQLVGQTDSVAIDKHPVARRTIHLVHLEDTLARHSSLQCEEQVLTETNRPAFAASIGDSDELHSEVVDLVDRVVNFDGSCCEELAGLVVWGNALGLDWPDT